LEKITRQDEKRRGVSIRKESTKANKIKNSDPYFLEGGTGWAP
jgi:hypothetical protein